MARDTQSGIVPQAVFDRRAKASKAFHDWSREAFHISSRCERGVLPIRTAIRRHHLRCLLAERMLRRLHAHRSPHPQCGAA